MQQLPLGVELLRTLEGHGDIVFSVAFDPAGRTLSGKDGIRVAVGTWGL